MKRKRKKREINIPTGWLTTDVDEINRRRLRGVSESFSINKTDGNLKEPFGSYSVISESKSCYAVELRDYKNYFNSCSCLDHRINRLGTCKHVEAVKYFLSKKTTVRKRILKLGSSRHEIFLDRSSDNVIKIRWAFSSETAGNDTSKKRLECFFSDNGTLLGKPVETIAKLKQIIAQEDMSANVILSQNLQDWLEEQITIQQDAKKKDSFLKDLEAGKRSFDFLKASLYDYQKEGILHLALRGRALLADEMGLGKTIQAIGACMLLKDLYKIKKVLVICPTSLKVEWEEQISKFCDESFTLIKGLRTMRLDMYKKETFFYIANYEQIRNDVDLIQKVLQPDVIVLDEAQRIKNWQSKTSQQIKKLYAPYLFVLTGTPLENRIDEIYSVMQVIDPQKLGSLFHFNREYYHLDERGKPIGPKNLDKLFYSLRDVILRRNKSEVEEQLPPCITKNYFVHMHEEQRVRYEEHSEIVAKILAQTKHRQLRKEEYETLQQRLACMRMLCDTPYILDPNCRISPKIDELQEVFEELLSIPENKIIIFSEWERMLQLIQKLPCFDNLSYAWHTGSVHQDQRREEILRFKNDTNCRVFLTTDAGATGLNLQAANIVINMDLPWNPAKLQQRIARAWRKHQKRSVQVINFITENSIEHNMIGTLNYKQALSDIVINGDLEAIAKLEEYKSTKVFTDRLEKLLNKAPLENTKDDNCTKVDVEQIILVDNVEEAICRTTLNNSSQMSSRKLDNSENCLVKPSEGNEAFKKKNEEKNRQITPKTLQKELDCLDPQVREIILSLINDGLLAPILDKTKNRETSVSGKYCNLEWVKKQGDVAEKMIEQAYRNAKMALLLMQGGFEQEAHTPTEKARLLLVDAYDKVIAISQEINDTVFSNLLEERMICKESLLEASILESKILNLKGHLQGLLLQCHQII